MYKEGAELLPKDYAFKVQVRRSPVQRRGVADALTSRAARLDLAGVGLGYRASCRPWPGLLVYGAGP